MDKNDKNEIYKEFIQSIEIEEITLKDLHVNRMSNKPDEKLRVNVEPFFQLSSIENGKLYAAAEFKVEANLEDSEETYFTVQGTYEVVYEIEKDAPITDEEIVKLFIDRNLPINIWPYIRELVSSITVRMGLPPLTLSTLKKFY